jgi:ATP-binding cassette subfamily B protein
VETKKIKEKKVKPKYNLFQNTAYMFKNIWDSGQKMLAISAIIRIPVSVILTVIALYTPMIILNRLEFSDTMQQLISVITALLIVTMFFNLINNYIGAKHGMMEHRMVGYYLMLQNKKHLEVDYEHLEDPKFQDVNSKASEGMQSNHTPAPYAAAEQFRKSDYQPALIYIFRGSNINAEPVDFAAALRDCFDKLCYDEIHTKV